MAGCDQTFCLQFGLCAQSVRAPFEWAVGEERVASVTLHLVTSLCQPVAEPLPAVRAVASASRLFPPCRRVWFSWSLIARSPVWESVAEHLPDEPVLGTSDPLGVAPDPAVDAEIAAFTEALHRAAPVDCSSPSTLHCTPDLPKKWLNPGKPKDLFWLYKGEPDSTGSYSTFKRVWRQDFQKILGFRPFGHHACCTDCSVLRAKIRASGEAGRRLAVEEFRARLRAQWRDRQLYWKVREKSRSLDGDLLTLIVDGADQSKFRIFKHLGPI